MHSDISAIETENTKYETETKTIDWITIQSQVEKIKRSHLIWNRLESSQRRERAEKNPMKKNTTKIT